MGAGLRRAVDVFTQLVVAVLGGFIAFWSADLLLDGMDIKTAGANLPQSINYLPLAVGGALMLLFALNRAWKALHVTAADADADAVDAEGDR
ncbi:Tripartite ATP-independent periplasmic transporter, DctQ component [compost metagenome]